MMNGIQTMPQNGLIEGRVLEATEDCFTVLVDDCAAPARRAAGCLLQPGADDVVLLYRRDESMYYILNVLERPQETVTRLALGAKAQIDCADELTVKSGHKLDLVSETLVSSSAKQQMNAHELEVNAQSAKATVGTFGFMAQKVDAAVKFLLQKLGRSYKTVETTDETHAANIRQRAEEVFTVESEYTVMLSDEITRIDGKQIQMG